VVSPSFSKAFTPASTGGTTTLTFSVSNPGSSSMTGVAFTDALPSSPAQMTVSSSTVNTVGCGSPTIAPSVGSTSISFSNGTIAANSTCTISVQVAVPATAGTYNNVSGNLWVGGEDTGLVARASLSAEASSSGTQVCTTMAKWDFSGTSSPPTASIIASNVSTATLAIGSGISWSRVSGYSSTDSLKKSGWPIGGFSLASTSYLQFSIDTSGYSSINLKFLAANGSSGPKSLSLVSGSTTLQTYNQLSTSWTQYLYNSLPKSVGTSVYNLYGYSAPNSGANSNLNFYEVIFEGCVIPTVNISKAFSSNPIPINGISRLTLTLTNPNGHLEKPQILRCSGKIGCSSSLSEHST
jgi:uncharacterized repeat protein (TIGR01451 family)